MNTQSQADAPLSQLSQLRSMIESMPVAMLSSIDEHGALLSCRMSRWEMDDCGALWFFTDPRCLPAAHMSSLNLSFADAAGSGRVSLSGRGELYAEDLCAKYLSGSVWQGRLNSPHLNARPPLDNSTLLKFTPQSAVYWHAEPSLMMRLLDLLASVLGTKLKVPSIKPGMLCVELPSAWKPLIAKPAR